MIEGLDQARSRKRPGDDFGRKSLMATTAAWDIFGAVRRWHQTPNRIPAEEMAAGIEATVKPVLLGNFESLKPST